MITGIERAGWRSCERVRARGDRDREAAKRIGQAPTTTDVTDPERSSRNTAAGSGSEPGEGPVQPAADEGVDPSASIEPHNEGLV